MVDAELNCRPRTSYDLRNRVISLANEISDGGDEIKTFHDAAVVVVDELERGRDA